MEAHRGCSPNDARCSDQDVVTMVLDDAIRRARAVMVAASTPQICAAQRASFTTPSDRPHR